MIIFYGGSSENEINIRKIARHNLFCGERGQGGFWKVGSAGVESGL